MQSLYDATKTQTPKIVVLEATVIYDDVSIVVPFSRIIQTVLPITQYHDRWKNLRWEDFYKKVEYTSTDYMKGFHYRVTEQPADVTNYMTPTDSKQEILLKNQIYLKIINEYCKAICAKFIIMSVPSTANWSYEKHNAVAEFAENEGIDFLDFNVITEELGIDWNKDTIDGGDHMNFNGSLKLTDYFEKYIEDFGILENHKNDSKYESWNEDLEKFKERIDGGEESH